MPALRCALCHRLLMVERLPSAEANEPPVICDPCHVLPAEERKRRRDQVMAQMLWKDLRATRVAPDRHATPGAVDASRRSRARSTLVPKSDRRVS